MVRVSKVVILVLAGFAVSAETAFAQEEEPGVGFEAEIGIQTLDVDGRLGVSIGPVSVLTGLGVSVLDEDDFQASSLRFPLEFKLYFVRPAEGAVAPFLRLGAFLQHARFDSGGPDEEASSLSFGFTGGGGVSYFVTPGFGVSGELGLQYANHQRDNGASVGGLGGLAVGTADAWNLHIGWRAGLVFRI